MQDLLANASHSSSLLNALQQHQSQQSQEESHQQIVIHSANPIECLDAALKVRNLRELEEAHHLDSN